jgi:SSS family solute:Na+ symporter/sodium/pantothenate symporter
VSDLSLGLGAVLFLAFYLAGRGLGGFVLLLTLYATQYSGNALLGYPGEAYRLGFAWVMTIGFMMAIVVVYLLFAPRLHRLAKHRGYVTPGDWVDHRFGSPPLTLLTNLLLVVSIANYLLAQLMAMGHVVAGLSGNWIPYWAGVLGLMLVIVIYETLGGLRAVAWTDCIQGLMLAVGLVGLLVAAAPGVEHLRQLTEWLAEHQPEKVAVPSGRLCRTWLSTLVLIGFSGAIYPQAVQRIYAARSVRALKQSLTWMVFMPLLTMTTVVLIGILGIEQFSSLGGIEADQVMPMLLRRWSELSLSRYVLVVLVLTGTLAAIMSTADSVLLSLSSILAKDFVGKTLLAGAPEERLTRIGKILSWIIMGVLALLAFSPRITLWGLTELKMEILAQASPVFVLGAVYRRLQARAALTGMVAGSTLAVALTLAGYARPWGFHAGFLGWILNMSLCLLLSWRPGRGGVENDRSSLGEAHSSVWSAGPRPDSRAPRVLIGVTRAEEEA